eukprot:1116375-Alexandrium_andersonii.AAC.1
MRGRARAPCDLFAQHSGYEPQDSTQRRARETGAAPGCASAMGPGAASCSTSPSATSTARAALQL